MSVKYYWARFLSKLKPNAIKKSKIDKTAHVGHGNRIVGSSFEKYSYAGDNCVIIETEIGKFCSIAEGCIIGGASHPIKHLSTSPVFVEGKNVLGKNFANNSFEPFTKTIIKNDVWIGNNCLIKAGVTIEDGAVIGMGSVVTKNVGAYEIWAGNPAKFIRKRFDDHTIEELLKTKWWDYSEKKISELAEDFSDVERFLEKTQNER